MKIHYGFVAFLLLLNCLPTKAVTVDFDSDQQYSATGGDGSGNLKGQPASGTQWTGGTTGKDASIAITANDGAAGTDQSAKTQVGSAAAAQSEYTFLPTDQDLGGTFDSKSSVVYYRFQLKIPTVASAYGTNVLRIRIGGPYDGQSAVDFGLSDNGAFIWSQGDGTGKGTSYFARTVTDGAEYFRPTGGVYFTVEGAINYATKTFTVTVNGVSQADKGNANFHFRSNEAPTCAFTLINFAASHPAWVPTSIDNVALSLGPITAALPPALIPPPSAAAPSYDDLVGVNLIKNPSFENPPESYSWAPNNWPKNDVDLALDPDNPHSGVNSQRIGIRKVTGKNANLQFTYRNMPLKPGMALELRFWTRGLPNTRPIVVTMRKVGAPYTTYFQAEVGLTKDWTESVFDFTLPPNTDPHAMLSFDLNEENTYWLDDVSLTPLPAQAAGEPLAGNQVKNGSFEVGHDHWYATFRTSEDSVTVNPKIEAMPTPDAPQGKNALTFDLPPAYSFDLTSAYFHLRYGHPVSIRFWMKTPAAGVPVKINLGQGIFPNIINESQSFTSADGNWNFYHFEATPKVSNGGLYYLEFLMGKSGTYSLDGVSVVEGDGADPAFPNDRIEVGWGTPDKTPPGNLFSQGDNISFPLSVAAPAGTKDVPLHLRLVDYRSAELKKWDVDVPVDADGHGGSDIVLPSSLFGAFKVEAFTNQDTNPSLPSTELIYSVVHSLPSLATAAPNSFYGAHVRLTPYNLAIAEKLGMRWLRLNPPLSTTWMSVEKTKGVFTFYTDGVALAHQMGFDILGLFTTTPWFYADGDPAKTRGAAWYNSYGPADWDAWATYVQKTALAFAPYIQAWEIWNEPNSHFLTLQPGVDKPATYVKIVQHTQQALDSAGIKAYLIGNVAGSLDGPFTWDELALGGSKGVDAISFHMYIEDRGPEEKQPGLADQLTKLRTYMNRSNEVPDLWCTEGGIWLDQGNTWLNSAEIPEISRSTVTDAANSVSRLLAGLKALGIKRFFYYAATAEPSGRTDFRGECTGIIDVNGIPHPGGAAYNASVYFLDAAKPLGLDVRPVGNKHVTVARFVSDKGPITVIWSRDSVQLSDITDLDWKNPSAFDLMGNPIQLSPQTLVTLDPIYLIVKGSSVSSSWQR